VKSAPKRSLKHGMLDAFPDAMMTYANGTRARRTEATSLVVSRDPEIVALVRRSCSALWCVEARDDWDRIDNITGNLGVGIIVVDDDVVPEEERSQLIANIHVWFPEGLIIYVAGNHSQAVERLARAGGVLSYTSKPVDAERLERLLRSLSSRALTLIESAAHRCVN
jgi:response regulator of citrate/malate metabolism